MKEDKARRDWEVNPHKTLAMRKMQLKLEMDA